MRPGARVPGCPVAQVPGCPGARMSSKESQGICKNPLGSLRTRGIPKLGSFSDLVEFLGIRMNPHDSPNIPRNPEEPLRNPEEPLRNPLPCLRIWLCSRLRQASPANCIYICRWPFRECSTILRKTVGVDLMFETASRLAAGIQWGSEANRPAGNAVDYPGCDSTAGTSDRAGRWR